MTGMLGIYWGTFLFGGILIASSIFLGDGDGDMDKDVSFDKDFSLDVDGDGVGDFDSMGWLPFLSLRFWTFFLGLFGLSGVLLTGMDTGETATLVTSGLLGVGMAYPIAYLFQHLTKDSVTSNTSSESYTQEMATTLLPFKPNGQGKIRISNGGELIDIIAKNPTSHGIEEGAEVLIVSMDDGIATISPVLRIEKDS
jgi:hypothetical protein